MGLLSGLKSFGKSVLGKLKSAGSGIRNSLGKEKAYFSSQGGGTSWYRQKPLESQSKLTELKNTISETFNGPINERISAIENPVNVPTEFTNKTKTLQSLNTVNRGNSATKVTVSDDSFNLVDDKYKNLADNLSIDEFDFSDNIKLSEKKYSDFHEKAVNSAKAREEAFSRRKVNDINEADRTDAKFLEKTMEEGGSFEEISNDYKKRGIDKNYQPLDFGSVNKDSIELKNSGINAVGKPSQKKTVKVNPFFEDGIDLTEATQKRYQNMTERHMQKQTEQAKKTVNTATGKTKVKANENKGTPDDSTGPKLSSHAALAVGALSGVGLTYALTRNRGQQSNAQLYGQQPLY